MATNATYTQLVIEEVQDTSTRGQSVATRAVKDAYDEILLEVPEVVGTQEEDVTATVSQRYVTPVNSYVKYKKILWHNATDTEFVTLKPISEEEYLERYVNSDDGEPTAYYVSGSRIYFNIAPSSTGTVRIFGIPVHDPLEDDTVSLVPDRFSKVMVLGGVARFKAYEGLSDAIEYLAMFHGPNYNQGVLGGALKRMAREYSVRQELRKPKLFGR